MILRKRMMNKIDVLKNIILSTEVNWEEKETTVDYFQYNWYMRFFEITDIDEESFNNKKYNQIKKTSDNFIKELSNSILNDLSKKYNSHIGKCYFVKLLPQRYPSRQYYELEQYESIISKVYIPVIVNDKTSFCINDQIINPNPGQEILSKSEDLVAIYNLGETDIVYLSIDLIPSGYFE